MMQQSVRFDAFLIDKDELNSNNIQYCK